MLCIGSPDDGLDEEAVHALQQDYPVDVMLGLKGALETLLHDQRSAFEAFLVPLGFLAIMTAFLSMQSCYLVMLIWMCKPLVNWELYQWWLMSLLSAKLAWLKKAAHVADII